MAEIQRTIVLGKGSSTSSLDQDMDTVFEALNQGMDPTALPPGKVTADKLNISSASTGPTGFRVGTGGQIPAGGVGAFALGINGNNSADQGPANGQFYIASLYGDIFVDPTGSGGVTISNIYTGNTVWNGLSLLLPSFYLRNSANPSPQLLQIVCGVHNFDSVAHWVYCTMTALIVNTPTSL